MTRTQCCDSNSKFKFTKSFSTLAAEECGRRGRSSGVLSSLALSPPPLAARATPRCNYGETRTELSTNWNGVSFFLLRSSFSLSLSVACFQPTTDLSPSFTLLARWLWGLGSDRVTILQNVQNEMLLGRSEMRRERRDVCLSACRSSWPDVGWVDYGAFSPV